MSIPQALAKELALPVSFAPDGSKMVTLEEFVSQSQPIPRLALSRLNSAQKAKVVAERIRRSPEVKIYTIGSGVIDKQQAIAEVEAQSAIGQLLIEAEQYAIEEATAGRLQHILKDCLN